LYVIEVEMGKRNINDLLMKSAGNKLFA